MLRKSEKYIGRRLRKGQVLVVCVAFLEDLFKLPTLHFTSAFVIFPSVQKVVSLHVQHFNIYYYSCIRFINTNHCYFLVCILILCGVSLILVCVTIILWTSLGGVVGQQQSKHFKITVWFKRKVRVYPALQAIMS